MATLAHKRESLVATVGRVGVSAHGARLAGEVGIHFRRHSALKRGFIGNIAVQFSKGPLGGMLVGPPLLLTRLFAPLSLRPLSDMGQVFQADNAVWAPVHNTPTDQMVDRRGSGGDGQIALSDIHSHYFLVTFGGGLPPQSRD